MTSELNLAFLPGLPFQASVVADHPYLESSRASLGRHGLEACVLDDGEEKALRVLLDGALIYKSGDAMPAAEWFDVCHEGGYRARSDWDRDPVSILFRDILPAMAEAWTEFPLPYGEDGFPEGVQSLATLQQAHASFIARLSEAAPSGAGAQMAEMFAQLPLRAVVLHDRPEQRVDYLGNALDVAYIGIDLILGNRPGTPARLRKVSLSSTGGMRWSPWLPGGNWANEGREFTATETAADFLRASGVAMEPLADFDEAFTDWIRDYASSMDEVVERYLAVYPAAIPWHHDLRSQYELRSVVKAEQARNGMVLTFDNGLRALIPSSDYFTPARAAARPDPAGIQAPL